MTVHNHGSEEGVGLYCNESRLPDGSLMGACLMARYSILDRVRDVLIYSGYCVDEVETDDLIKQMMDNGVRFVTPEDMK